MTAWISMAAAGGALTGLAVGLGLVMRLARPRLAQRLAEPPPAPTPAPRVPSGWVAHIGSVGIPLLAALGLPTQRTQTDLAVCERSAESYLAEKTTMALGGVLFPALVAMVLGLAGLAAYPPIGVGLWVGFALICWLAPDLALRSQAEHHRTVMRHAVADFAELVRIALAGGAGIHSALEDASTSGNSWAITRIRAALHSANIRGEPPWVALRELGERYRAPACGELAASLQLAGADGARVRASLAAKAHTLRTQHLADLDAHAQSATERMSLPVVLLFAGFLLLIAYPPVHQITTTL